VETIIITQLGFNKSFENSAVYEIMWKNVVQPDGLQVIIYLMRICMLDTYIYKHTLRICNTYCFSTATMVAWKRLDITSYVQFLSCSTLERYPPCKFTVHLEGVQDSFYYEMMDMFYCTPRRWVCFILYT